MISALLLAIGIIFTIIFLLWMIRLIMIQIDAVQYGYVKIKFSEFMRLYFAYPERWELETGTAYFRNYENGRKDSFKVYFSFYGLMHYRLFVWNNEHKERKEIEQSNHKDFDEAIRYLQRKDDQPDA